MAKKKAGWTPVYRFSGVPQLGITHFEVNTDNDGVSLISACDLTLGPLNEFLSKLDTTEHGEIVLLDPKGILVASSALDSFQTLESTSGEEATYRRVRGVESPTPLIREAVQHSDKNPFRFSRTPGRQAAQWKCLQKMVTFFFRG